VLVALDLLLFPLMVGALLLPALGLPRRRDPLEALMLGAGLGCLLWGAVALARFFLLLPAGVPRTAGVLALGTALILGLSLARLAHGAPWQPQPTVLHSRELALAISAVAALTLGLQAALPHYGVAMHLYDWWVHFDLARFYRAPGAFERVYSDGATIASRTPLFDLLGALPLTYLGNRFTVFQVFTAVVGWLWVLPLARLAGRLLGTRTPSVVALLGLSPLLLHSHTYTWQKGLVTFFVLLALDRLLALSEDPSNTTAFQLGLFSGAAVMTHAGFAGYVLPAFAFVACDAWRARRLWSAWLLTALGAVLVALPWCTWVVAQYGWSSLVSYPRAPYASAGVWIVDHLLVVTTNILPLRFVIDLVSHDFAFARDVFIVYLGSATGLLGMAFLFRALMACAKPRLPAAVRAPLLVCAGSGMLLATLLVPGPARDSANVLYTPGLLLLALIVLRVVPLSPGVLLAAMVECVVVGAAVLAWMWSPASLAEGNARLAGQLGIGFLGRETWPFGLALLTTGTAACLAAVSPWPGIRGDAGAPRVSGMNLAHRQRKRLEGEISGSSLDPGTDWRSEYEEGP